VDVTVVSVLPSLSWIQIRCSEPRPRPGSKKLFWQQQLGYLEPVDRLCSSATKDGSTQRDLLPGTMNESTDAQGFTFSSAPFGWFQLFACFRCICVIPCTR